MKKPLSKRRLRILCFSPHTDDEVIACGGTLASLAERGEEIFIVHMTDGAQGLLSFYPSFKGLILPLFSYARSLFRKLGNEALYHRLGRLLSVMRLRMALHAASSLGISRTNVLFLNYPETALANHQEKALADVKRIMAMIRPHVVIFPHSGDIHPDHIATNRSVSKALKLMDPSPRVLEYGVYRVDESFHRVDVGKYMGRKKEALKSYLPSAYVVGAFARLAKCRYEWFRHNGDSYISSRILGDYEVTRRLL